MRRKTPVSTGGALGLADARAAELVWKHRVRTRFGTGRHCTFKGVDGGNMTEDGFAELKRRRGLLSRSHVGENSRPFARERNGAIELGECRLGGRNPKHGVRHATPKTLLISLDFGVKPVRGRLKEGVYGKLSDRTVDSELAIGSPISSPLPRIVPRVYSSVRLDLKYAKYMGKIE